MMKLSDYVISFIEKQGIKEIFLVAGGGCMHLLDSVGRNKNIHYICNHHEQASAIAAEGYARMKNSLGAALVTTGPGGTNAITGVAGSWLDSIPVLIISGQVKLSTSIVDNPSMRQLGDQELNIIDIVKPITKYAVMIQDKNTIRYHLEKAVYLAQEGRPGPVWLDIPLDIQAEEIDSDQLPAFSQPVPKARKAVDLQVAQIIQLLTQSHRPLIIAGNGIRLAKGEQVFQELIEKLKIPVITAINGNDLVNEDYPYYVGRSGIMGQRSANFAMQNCDLLLSIGSRLILRQIGYNYQTFARKALQVVVDIDLAELEKKTINPDLPVLCDAKIFIEKLYTALGDANIQGLECEEWKQQCITWREKYPQVLPEHRTQQKYVNYYFFIEQLSAKLSPNDHIVTTNGTANVGTMQAVSLKKGQRLFTNTGLAQMGYGLPAAIGACVANQRNQLICIENDGSLQMNIQELQTVVHHQLPIKLFVINNDGYLSIKSTQKTYFPDNITAACPASGVTCPDTLKIAQAYGIQAVRISYNEELNDKLTWLLNAEGPAICEIMMAPDQELLPKTASEQKSDGSLVSMPVEDMYPFLPRAEFCENMLIPPWEENKAK